MTNNYTKLTKETFVERLKEGTYANDVAAKRGLGRAALSKPAKAVCLEAIEKYFKNRPAAKSKASKKKAPAKKKVAKKTTKKAASFKPGTTKKTRGRSTQSTTAAPRTPVPAVDAGKAAEDTSWMSEEMQEKLAQVHLARAQIGTIAQAIHAMKLAKEVHPELDVTEGSEASQRILTHAVTTLEATVESASPSNGVSSEPAPSNVPNNNDDAPVSVPTAEEIAEEIGE